MSRNAIVEASKEPTLMDDVRGVASAACGSSHSAYIADGQLYTFGTNKYHQLGREVGGDTESGVGAPPEPVVIEASDGHRPRVLDADLGLTTPQLSPKVERCGRGDGEGHFFTVLGPWVTAVEKATRSQSW